MPTNLQLATAVFTRFEGYFFYLNSTSDTLFKIVDSGEVAFSYPLDTDIVNDVKAMHYDGRYFYTLENVTTGDGQLFVKKWEIEDFVLKLRRNYTLTGTSTKKYNCNAFAIEHYAREIADTVVSGVNTLEVNDILNFSPGDVLNIGPSSFPGDEGKLEEVTLLATSGTNHIVLTSNVTNSYNIGDEINFSKKCWLFNKFRPSDPEPSLGSGQLYYFNLNPLVTATIAAKAGNEFRDVLAAGFVRDESYPGGAKEFLAFMRQTNLLFIDVDQGSTTYLDTIQSAAQNNQDPEDSTVIPVYDIAFEGNTLYRLQQKGVFRSGATYTVENWAPKYNYQLSTLERIPHSISVTPTPAIISADGVSTSTVTAIVKDQFDVGVASKTVNFSDNDTGSGSGFMNPTSSVTDAEGVAQSTYRSGVVAKTVTISVDV